MLPSFPQSQKLLEEEWNKLVFAAKAKTFPREVHPRVLPISEGRKADFQREDGQIKPFRIENYQVSSQHSFEDGKGMTIEDFNKKATEMGESLGHQMWNLLTGALNEAAAEAGTEIKIRKGELTQDAFLQLLEKVDHNFDEHGDPTQQFICGSEFAAELRKLAEDWSHDKEFQARAQEIKDRKKAEFYDREARRRLVG